MDQNDIANALKQRKPRFQDEHPLLSNALPFAIDAASAAVPALRNAGRANKLNNFVNEWKGADAVAHRTSAGYGQPHDPETSEAMNNLKGYHSQWPGMEERYKGSGISPSEALGWGAASGTAAIAPTAIDNARDPNSVTVNDWVDALMQAAPHLTGAGAAAHLGSQHKPFDQAAAMEGLKMGRPVPVNTVSKEDTHFGRSSSPFEGANTDAPHEIAMFSSTMPDVKGGKSTSKTPLGPLTSIITQLKKANKEPANVAPSVPTTQSTTPQIMPSPPPRTAPQSEWDDYFTQMRALRDQNRQ